MKFFTVQVPGRGGGGGVKLAFYEKENALDFGIKYVDNA
jgi:hypothetical protein